MPRTHALRLTVLDPSALLRKDLAIGELDRAREFARTRPAAALDKHLANEDLISRKPAKRQSAASRLGTLGYLDSYAPLLDALRRECEQGFGERKVKVAILDALAKIGEEHVVNHFMELRFGHNPLKRFILSHLSDTPLVELALKTLSWTGDTAMSVETAAEIRDAAHKAGNEETARTASRFSLNMDCRD